MLGGAGALLPLGIPELSNIFSNSSLVVLM